MKQIIGLLCTLALSTSALAQFIPIDDFEHCKWRDGRKIPTETCEDIYDEIESIRESTPANKGEEKEAWELKKQEEKDQYLKELTDRTFKLSKKKRAPYDGGCTSLIMVAGSGKRLPCDPDKKTTQEIAQEKEEAAQKRKCGKDYQTMRLGITIARLQECTGATYITKTVSQDGVIETYRTMFDFVDVQNGKVISFTKRRY